MERGVHPWPRLVHRLGSIQPHRQVQLLCAISVVTVAVMVAAVLGSLGPTHDSLQTSDRDLLPAIDQLEVARTSYSSAAQAMQLTIQPDPGVRATGLIQLTALNSAGGAAWKVYVKTSADLPRERALQRSFEGHRKSGFAAGLVLLSQPVVSAAALAGFTQFSDALRSDLNAIKALYEKRIHRSLRDARTQVGGTQQEILWIAGAAILLLLIAFGVAARSARAREERLEDLDRTLHEDAERNELETRLQRSLEMAHTEAAVYPLVGRALALSVPDVPAELLVADSSRAHFDQAASADDFGGPGCPVKSPTECPAATWGQTQIWNSSTALDACPHLQGRPSGACSAVCVPVSIGGKTVGVVHATAPDTRPPDDHVVAKIELIARKVGERIGMLRAFMRSETQAQTDPLTGLMNRRSFEEKVHEIDDGGAYVAAYGDLDHFKQLNDVYGHDAGDQALRLFARVLRETVRPNDITARYGGEEFVVVLPDCSIPDGTAVVDRIRERLALSQIGASIPPFTVSFGIATSRPEQTFNETLELADAALLDAKAKGRNRVIVAGAQAQMTGIISAPASMEAPTISSTRS